MRGFYVTQRTRREQKRGVMNRGMVWLGLAISLGFPVVAVLGMDWEIFCTSLIHIEPVWLLSVAAIAVIDLTLRSLSWNII